MISNSLIECIKKGPDGFPLTTAYKNEHRFYFDFVAMLKYFNDHLTQKQYRDIENKILAGSKQDEQSYIQRLSELVVLYYIMRMFSEKNDFKYEPTYDSGFNPECSFNYGGKTVNIEVKCPHMGKRIDIESHNTLKITFAERIPNVHEHSNIVKSLIENMNINDEKYTGVEIVPRMDNKLKDYLEHSQKKFPSGDKYFNILAITLETVHDLDEWYGYFFGDNGAFTQNSYIMSCYDRVDAVLLCTPVCGLRGWRNFPMTNVLHLEETINLLLLDPRKECMENGEQLSEKGRFYRDYAIDIFGSLTKSFLKFQCDLDMEEERKNGKEFTIEEYINFKEKDIAICSLFIENIRRNDMTEQ